MGRSKPSATSGIAPYKRQRAPKNCGDWPCFILGCAKMLTRKADVFRHLQVHWKDTIYNNPCSICPYSTRQAVNLKAHLYRHEKRSDSQVIHDSELMNFPRSVFTSKDPFAIKFQTRIKKRITKAKEEYDRLKATMAAPQGNHLSLSTSPLCDDSHRTISVPLTDTPPYVDSFESLSSTPTSYVPEIAIPMPSTSLLPRQDLNSSSSLLPTYPPHIVVSTSLPTTPLSSRTPLVPYTRNSQSEPPTFPVSGANTFDVGGYDEPFVPAPSFQATSGTVDRTEFQANTSCQMSCCRTIPPLYPYYSSYGGYEPAPQQMLEVAYKTPNPLPYYPIYSSAPISNSSSWHYPSEPYTEFSPAISTYQCTSSDSSQVGH